jgi:hypothetical protein
VFICDDYDKTMILNVVLLLLFLQLLNGDKLEEVDNLYKDFESADKASKM